MPNWLYQVGIDVLARQPFQTFPVANGGQHDEYNIPQLRVGFDVGSQPGSVEKWHLKIGNHDLIRISAIDSRAERIQCLSGRGEDPGAHAPARDLLMDQAAIYL